MGETTYYLPRHYLLKVLLVVLAEHVQQRTPAGPLHWQQIRRARMHH
jgi:hypothetical protein